MPRTEPKPISWTKVVGRAKARHNSTPGSVVESNHTLKYATTDVAELPTVVSANTPTASTDSQMIAVAVPLRVCAMIRVT